MVCTCDSDTLTGIRVQGPVKRAGTQLDEVQREAEKIHGGPLEGPYAVGGAPRTRCPFSA